MAPSVGVAHAGRWAWSGRGCLMGGATRDSLFLGVKQPQMAKGSDVMEAMGGAGFICMSFACPSFAYVSSAYASFAYRLVHPCIFFFFFLHARAPARAAHLHATVPPIAR